MAVEVIELGLPYQPGKFSKTKYEGEGEESEKEHVHLDTICIKVTQETILRTISGCTSIIKSTKGKDIHHF